MPRQRADNFPRGVRNHLLRASGGRCQQCGSTERLEVDHVVPARQGGRPEAANGQVLCWSCHRDKSARERGHVFVPDRCRHRHGRTFCCNTATLLEGWTKPGVALAPSAWRQWRRLCEDCAIHLLEYWASYGGVRVMPRYGRK
jgi:hypothetical protein